MIEREVHIVYRNTCGEPSIVGVYTNLDVAMVVCEVLNQETSEIIGVSYTVGSEYFKDFGLDK